MANESSNERVGRRSLSGREDTACRLATLWLFLLCSYLVGVVRLSLIVIRNCAVVRQGRQSGRVVI